MAYAEFNHTAFVAVLITQNGSSSLRPQQLLYNSAILVKSKRVEGKTKR